MCGSNPPKKPGENYGVHPHTTRANPCLMSFLQPPQKHILAAVRKPAQKRSSSGAANGVRGTDPDAGGKWPEEPAEIRTGIPAVMKYAILAMICALAFFIRLFAVVRVPPCPFGGGLREIVLLLFRGGGRGIERRTEAEGGGEKIVLGRVKVVMVRVEPEFSYSAAAVVYPNLGIHVLKMQGLAVLYSPLSPSPQGRRQELLRRRNPCNFCDTYLCVQVRYESVIHEFDPYFNFRTTKFLATEGFLDFLNWFDDRGW